MDKQLIIDKIKYLITVTDNSTKEQKALEIFNSYFDRTTKHINLVKKCGIALMTILRNKGYDTVKYEEILDKHDSDKLENVVTAGYYAVCCEYLYTKHVTGFTVDKKVLDSFERDIWKEHYINNPHHVAEHFGTPIDKDNPNSPIVVTTLVHPYYIAEMIADWIAVGMENGNTAKNWFNQNQNVKFVFSGENLDNINDFLKYEQDLLSVIKNPFKETEIKKVVSTEGWFDAVSESDPTHYTIRNFPINAFFYKLRKQYKTSKIEHIIQCVGISQYFFEKKTVLVHKFFIPEILYLLEKFDFSPKLRNDIFSGTWVGQPVTVNTELEFSRISKNMNCKLYPHQIDFINTYAQNKDRNRLRGYLLSFEQGLGKTITSLALMEALGKENIIIICPKNTMLETWRNHLATFYKNVQSVYITGIDKTYNGQRFCIFNYDAMDKLIQILPQLEGKNIGVIVDESHNFLRTSSIRTQLLIDISNSIQQSDLLMMSGTPLKCAGVEMIPLMRVLDPFFDNEAMTTFKLAFGVNTEVATDVLNARLTRMMTRVTKDVLNLPEKRESIIKIRMPTGKQYTATSVQKAMIEFTIERKKYHDSMMSTYREEFDEAMNYAASKLGNSKDFKAYVSRVKLLIKSNGWFEQGDPTITWMNKYEKEVLEPCLTPELLKKFRHSKAAVKYLRLKIRGEVLGECLMGLRMKMTSEMLQASPIVDLINEAEKKTLIFTSYVDTIEVCEAFLTKQGFKPLAIYGKTSDNLANLVKMFQTEEKWNPLIASLMTLSTGATLTAANRVIFLNKPWRSIEYQQASDRVHRIGQDCTVDIISLVLDTGSEPNLSTRMEDIMNTSGQLFDAIVNNKNPGGGVVEDSDEFLMNLPSDVIESNENLVAAYEGYETSQDTSFNTSNETINTTNGSSITLRPININNKDDIKLVTEGTNLAAEASDDELWSEKEVYDKLHDPKYKGHETFIVLSNNSPIGFLRLQPYADKDGKYIEIADFAIFKKYQKHGYGTVTLKKAIDYCKTNYKDRHIHIGVAKKNTIAIALYKKLGFEVIKEYKSSYLMRLKTTTSSESLEPSNVMLREVSVEAIHKNVSQHIEHNIVYHGSPIKYDVLKKSFMGKWYNDEKGIFVTPFKAIAKCFIISKKLILDELDKQGCDTRSINFGYDVWNKNIPELKKDINDITVMIRGAGDFKSFSGKATGYLYTIDYSKYKDKTSMFEKNKESNVEFIINDDITPDKCEKVTVNYKVISEDNFYKKSNEVLSIEALKEDVWTENIINSIDDLKRFYRISDYGTVINGTRYTTNQLSSSIIDKCKILTINEQLKYKIGMCYDTVGMSAYFLLKWNIAFKAYLCTTRREYDENNGIWDDPTHTFLIYNENGIWKWLEGSWGPHMTNTLQNKNADELVLEISQLLANDKRTTCYIKELKNYPKLGQSIHTFYKEMMKQSTRFMIEPETKSNENLSIDDLWN